MYIPLKKAIDKLKPYFTETYLRSNHRIIFKKCGIETRKVPPNETQVSEASLNSYIKKRQGKR